MPPKAGDYIPTLAIRPSEMNGLEYLPGISKDRMLPLILLAPWANANSLDKAIERVERAFPNRPFFLDIDHNYRPTNPESPAQSEWIQLCDPSHQFSAWREFWIERAEVIPCLQMNEQSEQDIRRQVEAIQYEGREFCLRIELQNFPRNLESIIDALIDLGTADFTVVIEGGWVRDSLSIYAQADGLISGILSILDGRIPIVISCTSMPKGFQEIQGLEHLPFTNHELLSQIRRGTNKETILYGDWGSTRPREDGAFGRTPLPRIDYPTNETWHVARNKDEGWGFQRAAQEIVNSPIWDGNLGIWGEEMIEGTSVNPSFAIDTPQKNVAARVNIHLHRQALFGDNLSGIDLDEEWVD